MLSTNLLDFKEIKRCKKILYDLEHMLIVFDKSQQAFKFFEHYVMIQEVISVMETNKTLINIYIKQYTNKLQDLKDKKEGWE